MFNRRGGEVGRLLGTLKILFAQRSCGTTSQGGFGRSGHRHTPILTRMPQDGESGPTDHCIAFYAVCATLDLT